MMPTSRVLRSPLALRTLAFAVLLLACQHRGLAEPAAMTPTATALPALYSQHSSEKISWAEWSAAAGQMLAASEAARAAAPSAGATPQWNETPGGIRLEGRVHLALGPGNDAAGPFALAVWQARYGYEVDGEPLLRYLVQNPSSRWRTAALVELGGLWLRRSHFFGAAGAYRQAWQLSKDERGWREKALADTAASNVASILAGIGQIKAAEKFIKKEFGSRPCTRESADRLQAAKETVQGSKSLDETTFHCGPIALRRLMEAQGKAAPLTMHKVKPQEQGFSLLKLQQMASEAGLPMQAAYRDPGATVLSPAIVHWRAGHYAALVPETSTAGAWRLVDAAFGGQTHADKTALDQEASGYFLVPEGVLPAGWRRVEDAEAGQVFGKGNVNQVGGNVGNTGVACPGDPSAAKGMPVADIQPFVVGHLIFDTPFFYSPPKGPEITWDMTYRQISTDGSGQNGWMNNWEARALVQYEIDPWYSCAPPPPGQSGACPLPQYYPSSLTLRLRKGGTRYIGLWWNSSSYSSMALGGIWRNNSSSEFQLAGDDGSQYEISVGLFSWGEPQPFNHVVRTTREGEVELYEGFGGDLHLARVTDPSGNAINLGYDNLSGRLTTITDAANRVTHIGYDADGNVDLVEGPYGSKAAHFTWEQGYLKSAQDQGGLLSTFEYGSDGIISSMTTPYGTTTFQHEDLPPYPAANPRRYAQHTDPEGNKERVEFRAMAPGSHGSEALDQVPALPGSESAFINNQYLDYRVSYYWNKRAMQEGAGDYAKAHQYHWIHDTDMTGMVPVLESEKAPLENRIWYHYEGQETPYKITGAKISKPSIVARVVQTASGPQTQAWHYTYDAQANLIGAIDPLGRETRYTYDGLRLTDIKRVSGGQQQQLASYYYAPGNNTVGSPDSATDASGKVTQFSYTSFGKIQSVTLPMGETSTWNYNADGTLNTFTPPTSGDQLSFGYDSAYRVQSVSSPKNGSKTMEYDAFDRPKKVTYLDGTHEDYTYDRLDLESYTDRNKHLTSYRYNSLRQLKAVHRPDGSDLELGWCGCGLLDTLTDGGRHTTQWLYDLQGRLKTKVYADNTTVDYKYDLYSGRLIGRSDAMRQDTLYTYTLDDRLSDIVYEHAKIATPNVHFTYDSDYGRLQTMDDGTGHTTFTYHPIDGVTLGAGRLAQVSGPMPNSDINYSYDEDGRQLSRDIHGVAEALHYDAQGRVDNVTNPLGQFGYTYDPSSVRLRNVAYPNGASVALDYLTPAEDGRLKQIKNLLPGTVVASQFDYLYDPAGNITHWTQLQNGQSKRYDLGYDPIDQLTQGLLKDPATEASLATNIYGYDKAGNRTSQQIDNQSATAHFNPLNELMKIDASGPLQVKGQASKPLKEATVQGQPAVLGDGNSFQAKIATTGGTQALDVVTKDFDGHELAKHYQVATLAGEAKTLAYDLNGNMTSDGTLQFDWDAANRLVKVTQLNPGEGNPAHTSEFTYDGLWRRVRMLEKLGETIVADRKFIWAGAQPAEERDSSNTVVKRFYGSGVQVVSGANIGSYYYERDHLGSIRNVLDASGNVTLAYDYDLWGRRTKVSGAFDVDFGYAGYFEHMPSGLALTLFRGYSPLLGRWVSRDPIGERGGVNIFQYVGNRSTSFRDSLGLYIDLNFTYVQNPAGGTTSLVPGWTIGIQFDETGIYTYYGPAGGEPGPSGGIYWGPFQNVSPGINTQIAASYGEAVAGGFDEKGKPFVELGLATPSFGYSSYDVEPLTWAGWKGDFVYIIDYFKDEYFSDGSFGRDKCH